MKYAILGTGMVGSTIGSKLISQGHEVKMGSRTADNEKALIWMNANGNMASIGTFAEAAAFADVIFNCTGGGVALNVMSLAGAENLEGKVLIDISNPLDFSQGMPPILNPALCNTTSVAEEIQKGYPGLKVVKTLNTMNCNLMVDASLIAGDHDVFLSGNDAEAKQTVRQILNTFGWKSPIDLGDISTARGY